MVKGLSGVQFGKWLISRQPRCGSPNSLIMGTITDQNVRHKVLLPINHNLNKICDILLGYFLRSKHKLFFASSEKEPF